MFLLSISYAHASQLEDFSSVFGDEAFVSIATGRAQHIGKAPAVASVITAENIKEMGATSLEEILETVPGVHVTVESGGYTPVYLFRGVYSAFNPHVLLLINGTPMTNVFFGNRGQVWGGMPVESIERVEIIRGPGSAVYGADAFSGVINVITKSTTGAGGTEFGVRGGSFETRNFWVQNGRAFGDLKVFSSLEYRRSDGHSETVDSDAQTPFDQTFSTSASLAPGPVNLGLKWLDARVDLDYKLWSINIAYQGRHDIGTGAGVAQALDPEGKIDGDRYNLKFAYRNPTFADNWELSYRISYLDVSNRSDLVIFPQGAFAGAFPNGLIGSPKVYERHTRVEGDAFYSQFVDHTLRIGAGAHIADMYKIEELKNFNPDGSPIGSVVNVTDTADVFVPEKDREVYYAYIQDEWNINADFFLTAGLRFDHYSDFGSTANPRLALVWNLSYDTTTKFLYGRAFRPPSFAELFNINNPVALGNANLDPETIDTYEWAFDFHPLGDFNTRVNLYYHKMKDIIQFTPDAAPATSTTAQNTAEQIGHGIEWEVTWKINEILKLSGNYANQRTRDKSTNESVGHAPQQQIYSKLNWRALPELNAAAQINWVADRKRIANDSRPTVNNYTTLDFTLRYTIKSNWELSLIGKNIFDANVREPSPAPGSIPNDLPLAGRSVFFEVRYSD